MDVRIFDVYILRGVRGESDKFPHSAPPPKLKGELPNVVTARGEDTLRVEFFTRQTIMTQVGIVCYVKAGEDGKLDVVYQYHFTRTRPMPNAPWGETLRHRSDITRTGMKATIWFNVMNELSEALGYGELGTARELGE